MVDDNVAVEQPRGLTGSSVLAQQGRRGISVETAVLWGTVVALVVLILYPLFMLLLRSLQTENLRAFTLDNYVAVLTSPRITGGLANSVLVSAGTTLFATVLGVSLAWINVRTNTPGARVFGNLNLLPFFTSSYVGAIAWTLLASKNSGLLNRLATSLVGTTEPLFNIYTPLGIIWVLALFETPVVYLFTIGAFRKMDPSLEESARVAGSGLVGATLRVTLPLATPSILAAALLVFVGVMGAFEVPLALGAPAKFPVLTTELYTVTTQYPPRFNLATATSGLLLVICAAGLLIQRRIILRRDYITVTGKGYRPAVVDIGRFRYVAFGWNALYLFVAVLLPMLALILISTQRVWTGRLQIEMLTLEHYRYVLFEYDVARRGIVNSGLLAVGGATLGMVLGLLAAYLVFRSRLPGRTAVDLLAATPIAIPGVILAIGVLVGWIRTPLYATLWIMMIAYIARFLPFAQRSAASSLLSLSPELDECARVSGASWLAALRDIILPLLKPGLIAGWLLLFIIFLRELGMSLFLYANGTETMSVALFMLTLHGDVTTAAFSVVQTLIILAAVVTLRRLSRESEVAM